MDAKIVDHLMRKKHSVHGEISAVLFEQCNLSCSFCPQDHSSKAGMDDILGQLENIRLALEHLETEGKKTVILYIQGGELFHDGIPDRLFDNYYDFARLTHEYAGAVGIDLKHTFVTNLVHTKTQRVIDLFERIAKDVCDVSVTISYDPTSRFVSKDFEQFKTNVDTYSEFITMVTVLLTKPTINKFKAGEAKFFDTLYERFPCEFNFYQLESHRPVQAPTDQELQSMFLLLVDKYPRVGPILGYFSHDQNDAIYQHTENAMHGKISGFCDANLEGKIFSDCDVTFQDMEFKFLKDMGCLNCEWFDRCGLGSIPQHYFDPTYRTLKECWQKEVHRSIDKKARI